MSISDYLADGGYLPGLSDQTYYGFGAYEYGMRRSAGSSTEATRQQLWNQLCSDPRWKHTDASSEETKWCGKEINRDPKDYWGKDATWEAVPVPKEGMHKGARAPKWVWESTPIKLEKESEETYLKRLVCALAGRFVCLIGADEEGHNKGGVPQTAERYRWRYWDNEGHVYQDYAKKWTTSPASEFEDIFNSACTGPGEFEMSPLWMFTEGSIDREFWDAVWYFRHKGSYNEGLIQLAKQAGVDTTANELNEESFLERMEKEAKENGIVVTSDDILDESELGCMAPAEEWNY